MVLLNSERLIHWLVGAVLVWAAFLLLLFIPVFHFVLGFSIVKIVVSVGIGCAVQLMVTPWFFSARPTARNPSGDIAQRAVAAIVWSSVTALLFFYYIQRDWPKDSHANAFRACLFGTTIVFAIGALILVRVFSRHNS
jgi:hypothetical protein